MENIESESKQEAMEGADCNVGELKHKTAWVSWERNLIQQTNRRKEERKKERRQRREREREREETAHLPTGSTKPPEGGKPSYIPKHNARQQQKNQTMNPQGTIEQWKKSYPQTRTRSDDYVNQRHIWQDFTITKFIIHYGKGLPL